LLLLVLASIVVIFLPSGRARRAKHTLRLQAPKPFTALLKTRPKHLAMSLMRPLPPPSLKQCNTPRH
jgi:hypothetical protein